MLSTAQVQAGIRAKGDTNVSVSQQLVNVINQITQGYSLYRQVAFVAHTIWESGSYQFTQELNTANHGNYQDCDANQPGLNAPTTGKLYYGRGYLQVLSHGFLHRSFPRFPSALTDSASPLLGVIIVVLFTALDTFYDTTALLVL